MQIQRGIKESSELLQFLGSFTTVTDQVLADGKVNPLELAQYFNTILGVKSAVEGIKDVPLELGDLTADERVQLTAVLADSLRLRNGISEELAEEGFDLALRLVQYVVKVGKAKRGA